MKVEAKDWELLKTFLQDKGVDIAEVFGGDIEVEDDVTALFEYPNGATGTYITTVADAPGTNRFEITGTRGKIVLEDNKLSFSRLREDTISFNSHFKGGIGQPECWKVEVPVKGTYTSHPGIITNFCDAILKGTKLIAPGEEGILGLSISSCLIMVKKRTFKKNVVASWGITYFVIFVIPIVLFFFFIAIFMSIIDEETSYYNGLAVEHVKFTMDSIFADVNASATELFMDEDFDDISQYEEFRDIPAYLLFQQVSSLQRVDTTKSYIDGLIVYSPSMDLYISTVRYGRLSRIHSLMEYNLQLTQEEATEIFSDRIQAMEIHDASYTLPNGREIHRVIITRPLNYLSSKFYVAAIVSLDSIRDNESDFGQYNNIMLFSSVTGKFIFDLSDNPVESAEDVTLFSLSSNENPWRDDIIATAPSDETNFTYVIRIEKSEYYRPVYLMYSAMIVYIIVAGLFTAIFSVRRIRKDWSELENAINEIGADTEEADGIYSPFVSSVSRLEREKEGLGSVIEKQTASLKSSMLKTLVSGPEDGFVSQNALEECGISFPTDKFMVFIAETENTETVENAINEVIPKEMMKVYPFPSQYGAAVLFSFTEEYLAAGHDVYRDIASYADKLPLDIISGLAASDKVEGVENIGNAYVSAISTLEYRKNMNIHELVFSRDVNAMANGRRYIYSPESAYVLSNAVSEGNVDEAIEIIRDVYQKNTEAGVSPRHLRYLLFAISNDILRISVKLEDIFGSQFVPFSVPVILQTRNPETVRLTLEENVKKFCSSVVEARNAMGNIQDETYRIYQKAIALIGERYSDPMLNVSEVADSLSISLAYLSKIFKRYHRMNISDYISHIRVEVAKRLLEKGEQIQEIADKCGFGSLRTFMRVFRKLEGVTPGQYRSFKQEEG